MSRGQNGDGEDSAKSARMAFAPCSRLEDPSAVRSPVLRGEARTICGRWSRFLYRSPFQRPRRARKTLRGEPCCENAVSRSGGKPHCFHHADRATIDDKACEATGAGNSDRVGDGFLRKSPDLARNQRDTVGGRTQGMETTLDEGDRVIDAHAGLVASDHRLNEIKATSSILLAKRNGCRKHLARMKWLGADIGIVRGSGPERR